MNPKIGRGGAVVVVVVVTGGPVLWTGCSGDISALGLLLPARHKIVEERADSDQNQERYYYHAKDYEH